MGLVRIPPFLVGKLVVKWLLKCPWFVGTLRHMPSEVVVLGMVVTK